MRPVLFFSLTSPTARCPVCSLIQAWFHCSNGTGLRAVSVGFGADGAVARLTVQSPVGQKNIGSLVSPGALGGGVSQALGRAGSLQEWGLRTCPQDG